MHQYPARIYQLIKIFFLLMSVILLARMGMSSGPHYASDTKVFSVDYNRSDRKEQIATIHDYLIQTTGQEIGLMTISGEQETVIIPATRDYQTYQTYLYGLGADTGAYQTTNLLQPLEPPASPQPDYSLMIILFLLLALFL